MRRAERVTRTTPPYRPRYKTKARRASPHESTGPPLHHADNRDPAIAQQSFALDRTCGGNERQNLHCQAGSGGTSPKNVRRPGDCRTRPKTLDSRLQAPERSTRLEDQHPSSPHFRVRNSRKECHIVTRPIEAIPSSYIQRSPGRRVVVRLLQYGWFGMPLAGLRPASVFVAHAASALDFGELSRAAAQRCRQWHSPN